MYKVEPGFYSSISTTLQNLVENNRHQTANNIWVRLLFLLASLFVVMVFEIAFSEFGFFILFSVGSVCGAENSVKRLKG